MQSSLPEERAEICDRDQREGEEKRDLVLIWNEGFGVGVHNIKLKINNY